MIEDKNVLQWCFAFGATLLQFLFGGWSLPLQILVAFIALDYVTGLGSAFVLKELDSSIGSKGIAKKVGFMVLVAVAHLLDTLTGMASPVLQTATMWFLIANEGISITENLGAMGVPIPNAITDALKRLKEGKHEQFPTDGEL